MLRRGRNVHQCSTFNYLVTAAPTTATIIITKATVMTKTTATTTEMTTAITLPVALAATGPGILSTKLVMVNAYYCDVLPVAFSMILACTLRSEGNSSTT